MARALEEVGTLYDSRITAVCRRHGLSHAGTKALAIIEGAGRPLTPGEIGAAMHITSGSITSVVDTLECNGLVERLSHDDDRRKVLVTVTTAGVDLLDRLLPDIQALVRDLLGGLSEDEQRSLLGLLERARASANALTEDPVAAGERRNPRRAAGFGESRQNRTS